LFFFVIFFFLKKNGFISNVGIIMAIILQGKMDSTTGAFTSKDYYSGYSIFWAGQTVGWSNLACG
jgi:V-type H+-transporting ATPase 21kDa proteolipid subunit